MIYFDLTYAILLGMALIYLAVGLWAASSIRTLQTYFLADRNLGIFKLTIALIASQLGSGIILGTAERGYLIGFKALLYMAGLSTGLIILGLGLAARIRSLNLNTIPEIFETYYHSKNLKMLASTVSIVSLWGILVAQIVASKEVFAALSITDFYIITTIWISVIAYSMLGCLTSLVFVNVLQVLFFVSIFLLASKWLIPKTFFKFISFEKLQYIQHRLFKIPTERSALIATFFIPTLYTMIEQDTAQKIFAAKTKITAAISCILAAIGLISISALIITFTIVSKIENVNVTTGINPLLLILQESCPSVIFITLLCAILGGIMTTASSLLCAINSNVIQDFTQYLHFQRAKLWTVKTIALCIGLSALLFAHIISWDILTILEQSYRLFVVCFFIPIMIAYIKKSALPSLAAWASCITGCTAFIITFFFIHNQILQDITALLSSLFAFLIVYLFISRKNS